MHQVSRRESIALMTGALGMMMTRNVFASKEGIDERSSPAEATASSSTPESTSNVLVVVVSIHHGNTKRLAEAMAGVLNARILTPDQVDEEALRSCTVVGLGSGIYDQMHHPSVLELVKRLPRSTGRRTFIFSTSGVSREFAMKGSVKDDPHTALRDRLLARGCPVKGEFNCVGWNTNSFLRFFGGMNKGRPDNSDLERARRFALQLTKDTVTNSGLSQNGGTR